MRLGNTLAGTALALVMAAGLSHPALAQSQPSGGDVDVTQGVLRPTRIAIAPFIGPNGGEITGVISNNLQRSGYFSPIDPNAFIERELRVANQPTFDAWTRIGAEAVLYGEAQPQPDGRVAVAFRLYDPYRRCQLVGYRFVTTPENWRRVAHKVSDVVYQRMTGEPGYFDTRIAYVAESGSGPNRSTQLAIMDQDGFNPVYLTRTDEIIITPRFSANSDELVYMALGRDYTRIYMLNIATGRRESLGQFQGNVFAPQFSPDGTRVAFSIERGGNTDIYVMNLQSRNLQRLTTDPGIDTSPSFSPDGRQIVFNSDRGGRPRLYIMNADGSNQRPISRGSGNYHTPAWSPRGDLIAFTKQQGGRFHIGVMAPDGTGERIVSSSYFEEGPSWAPNGRYLVFSRQQGSSRLWMVDVTGRVTSALSYGGAATDPAWSPLLDPPPSNLGFGDGPDSCPLGAAQ
ncbi:MAG: Tol-Pal system beta propeller repeat protein TolB [Brevundimonas sp.]|uniref:Tol-Pal system beta propeller repeat protein TolB n=1 Tax=Brevundimonas sp. TaxID=1871086 RepID=UPI003918B67D